MTDLSDALPNGWIVAPLDELLVPLEDGRTLHHGWSPQCEKEPSGSEDEWGVLKTTAIQPGAFLPEHNKKLPSSLAPRPQHEVKEGDLLITCAGPRVRCGIPCLVRSTRPRLMLSGKMYRFRVSDEYFDARYLEKYLLSHKAQTAIEAMKTGGSDSGLNLTHDRFKPIPVPVAPLNEQRRIASKIDELFSRIEEGERALERAQELVVRYRQSVLKAAVVGELTRTWRQKNNGDLESGEALLARILKARRGAWEKAELGKMKAKGITPANDKWKQKYEEPSPPNATDLPDLPEGWVWVSVEQIGFVQLGRQRSPDKMTGQHPVRYIRAANITTAGIDLDDIKQMDFDVVEQSNFRLVAGDVLLTEASGSPQHVGRPAVWPQVDGLYCFQNTVLRVRPCVLSSDFLFRIFQAAQELGRFKVLSAGVGINHLSAGKLSPLAIPLPPLSEQLAIVETLSVEFTRLEEALKSVAMEASRARALRQALLQSAFSGKLVPQDSTDEPASTLLEHIAAERSARLARLKRGRKNKTRELA